MSRVRCDKIRLVGWVVMNGPGRTSPHFSGYAVEEKPEPRVTVAAMGVKHHNELRIGKERIDL